jgi:hypothetical protein
MKTTLIGAADIHYEKEGQKRQFYVLRCLAPAKNYGKSKTENLGLEQKELFVEAGIYAQAKAIKNFPVEVEVVTQTDLFINRVEVQSIRLLSST